MDADIHTLYSSDFYTIRDFKCRCTHCRTSEPEYGDSFCISFVRKGNFIFNVFRQTLDAYNGCVLVTKPGYERTVTHAHAVPDECTIFDFRTNFYTSLLEQYSGLQFLFNNDLHSTLLRVNTAAEFLHFKILQLVLKKSSGKLEIDNLVLEIIENTLGNTRDDKGVARLQDSLKKNHLITIEKAKEYITLHFQRDISLMEIAKSCHVSPFHFSRIFKKFTGYSPHQFLLGIRLKSAELQLKNTSLPVADIAFSSGFNSAEHFTAAFCQKYNYPPSVYRGRFMATNG